MRAWWWGLQQSQNLVGYCWPLSIYSIHQESSLHVIFNKAIMMLGINGRLPLTNPSIRNHFFLLHDALNMVRIIFCIVCLNLTIPCTRKPLFLQSAFHGARILLVITGLPLPIPSTRNHLFLLYGVFNRARIMFGIAGLPVDMPSTMNHLQITLNRARIILGIACLPLTVPFTRNRSCLWHQDHVGYCWPPFYCFIHQESSLSLATP